MFSKILLYFYRIQYAQTLLSDDILILCCCLIQCYIRIFLKMSYPVAGACSLPASAPLTARLNN